MQIDQDAVLAAADLIKRSGASDMEVGYHEDESENQWWAVATYRGAKITVDNQPTPDVALEALVKRIFTGGMCNHCKKPVVLDDDTPGCRWRRMGPKWVRGCEETT